MRSMRGLFVKIAGGAAAAGLLMIVLSGFPAAGTSPYVSALGQIATGQVAEAASGCSNRTCDRSGTRCVHINGSNTDCGIGDFCRTVTCL